jgi:hypothetical protein
MGARYGSVLFVLLLQPGLSVRGQPPLGNATTIFTAGDRDQWNQSWACVRGPALVRAPNGSLLAFARGMSSCADGAVGWSILSRVSDDNGSTWGAINAIASDANTTGGYVGPTVDRNRGTVLLLYNRRFVETWQTSSSDSGATWTAPTNITNDIGVLAIGPPGGVQLSSGRLVQAVHGARGTAALFSDDGGVSWRLGSPVAFPSGVASGGESQVTHTHTRTHTHTHTHTHARTHTHTRAHRWWMIFEGLQRSPC